MKKMIIKPGTDHECVWRQATLKLAKCVVATLQADGKIGIGSGLVMRTVNGKKVIERWDKDFIEALAFIGIAVVTKKPRKQQKMRPLHQIGAGGR
jgi:hypothetical protein